MQQSLGPEYFSILRQFGDVIKSCVFKIHIGKAVGVGFLGKED